MSVVLATKEVLSLELEACITRLGAAIGKMDAAVSEMQSERETLNHYKQLGLSLPAALASDVSTTDTHIRADAEGVLLKMQEILSGFEATKAHSIALKPTSAPVEPALKLATRLLMNLSTELQEAQSERKEELRRIRQTLTQTERV